MSKKKNKPTCVCCKEKLNAAPPGVTMCEDCFGRLLYSEIGLIHPFGQKVERLLKDHGIEYVIDLFAIGVAGLRKLKGIGAGTLKVLCEVFTRFGAPIPQDGSRAYNDARHFIRPRLPLFDSGPESTRLCPFCGHEVHSGHTFQGSVNRLPVLFIKCPRCDVTLTRQVKKLAKDETKDEAFTRCRGEFLGWWNTRVDNPK